MFAFAARRKPRRPALTPLIDVVFLLLVFFMLAAQFGRDGALELTGGGAGGYRGPPRLVTILPGAVLINGVAVAEPALADTLRTLTESPSDAIVLQARDGADVQRLTDLAQRLTTAGYSRLILVE